MIDTPQITQTAAQHTAVIRLTIPRSEVQTVMGAGHSELIDTVAAQGVTPTGPWFTHHLRMDPETFDFEIGVPVAEPISPAGRVQPAELPATKAARTVYRGGYEGLGDGWGEFMAWIEAEGLAPADDLWEVYVTGPESGPDATTWTTELTRPLMP